jgi:hypothetical protein
MLRSSIPIWCLFGLFACLNSPCYAQGVYLINDFNCADSTEQPNVVECSDFFPNQNGLSCPVACHQVLGIQVCVDQNGASQFTGYEPPNNVIALSFTEGDDIALAAAGSAECGESWFCYCSFEGDEWVCKSSATFHNFFLMKAPNGLPCPDF